MVASGDDDRVWWGGDVGWHRSSFMVIVVVGCDGGGILWC